MITFVYVRLVLFRSLEYVEQLSSAEWDQVGLYQTVILGS